MESHAERRGLARGEPLVIGVRSGAERARALRRLLDDLALGTLCLASAARELTTNPPAAELHADLVEIGVALFGIEPHGLVRAADLVLGLGDPHVLPLLCAATYTPGLDRAGLLRISARHVLEARGPDARQGKEEALLTAWYAGSEGGGRRSSASGAQVLPRRARGALRRPARGDPPGPQRVAACRARRGGRGDRP